MDLTVYTDGGSLNNPGEAAFAFAIYEKESLIFSFSGRLGIRSNNFAEYTGLIRALEEIKNNPFMKKASSLLCVSDSLLMVNQLNGQFRVKHPQIKELHTKVKALEVELNIRIRYVHVLREKNEFADSLVKKALSSA